MSFRRLFSLSLAAALSLPAPLCFAATPEEAGRAVLERYGPAVVSLRFGVKTRMTLNGEDRTSESKTETVGTVVDASGLTVISLSSIDPGESVKAMAAQQSRRSGQKLDVQVESEVTDAAIVLPDATEIAAHVVLRDKDLDLALVQPNSKPSRELVHVDLAGGATPQVLDPFVALYRLGKMANRAPVASIERVNAAVQGPRPYFVPGTGQGLSGIGSPVFGLDGALFGFILIRSSPPDDDGNVGSMFNGSSSMGLLPIIVPVAQVREAVAQAHESE